MNYVQMIMILAMAMGHTVGRPVMRMGGGTNSYGADLLAAVWCVMDRYKGECFKSALQRVVRILSKTDIR